MKRFHHEEQREAANEYWGRIELERFRTPYCGTLPPILPAFNPPPLVFKTRQEMDEEWEADFKTRPPCSNEELEEFRTRNHLSKP